MEDRAIRAVPWTLVSFAANKTVSLLSMLVLARLLAPGDFGLMAIAATAINLLTWLGGLGFSGALVVHRDLDRRGEGTLLVLVAGSSAVSAALAVASGPAMAGIFDEPQLTGILAVLGAAILLTGLGSFYDVLLQSELRFRARFGSLSAQTVTIAGVSIGLAVGGAGVWSLAIGQVAGALAYVCGMAVLAPRRLRPAWDGRVARLLARTGGGFFGQGVATFVRQNVDTVAVAGAFGSRALGFYSMAYRLGDLTYWAIADPVIKVTFPGFARSRHRGEDVRPTFLAVLRLVALVVCPVGVLLSACAAPFIATVFGARWAPMEGPLTLLGLWAALRPLDATLSWLLNSLRRQDAVLWASLAILVPLGAGVVLAAAYGSLTTMALVPLLDTVLAVALFAAAVRRYAEIPLRDQWRSVRPVLLAAPPMWVAGHFAAAAVAEPAALSLAAGLAAGLAAYAAALTACERTIIPRSAGQIARTLGRRPATVAHAPEPVAQGAGVAPPG